MSVKVMIPTPLRAYAEKADSVQVEGKTAGEVLNNLAEKYSQLKRHIYDERGNLRSYINIYVNDEDIRYLQNEKTEIKETDIVSIVPSIAGGAEEDVVVEMKTKVKENNVRLSNEEILRYSRHLIMPEVGMTGQKKLKAASILTIGAGGLGSPLGMYLAAAGVGKLGIVDFDVVDETNLQRQLLHGTSDIGRSKLESAKEKIKEINPNVKVETYETMLNSENALEILKDYDLVVDGTDNFPTRYLVNDACVLLGKPYVYGSIFRFEGQVTVFDAKNGPCYRCLYPTPPPPGLVLSCAEGGVLGVLPGIIGSLQALEAIKLIIGSGDSLTGRLILFDALKFKTRELKLHKNPDCPVCGENPTIHELIDYQQFCGISYEDGRDINVDRISVEELKKKIDNEEDIFLLDVRGLHEYEINNINNGYLIPLSDLPNRVNELDSSREIVAYCKVGGRSARAVDFLRTAGFKKVKNLVGGIDAWAQRIDKNMPRY
jgi:molybdopterin/thiamine biosynthesis adenylyltransferase/rhodanese-related sulfurtransferase/molybdopterin converting factor small subunit